LSGRDEEVLDKWTTLKPFSAKKQRKWLIKAEQTDQLSGFAGEAQAFLRSQLARRLQEDAGYSIGEIVQ